MKKLMCSALSKITNKKGESIVESICSIVIFTILVVSVMMIVNVSVQIVKSSLQKGNAHQQTVNRMTIEDTSIDAKDAQASLIFDGETMLMNVKIYKENGMISFKPNP